MMALAGLALAVAYTNGANDNFKGVATLYGSGALSYRAARWWAAGATLLGALASALLAPALASTFSGAGLVPDSLVGDPAFAGSVLLAAALTVSIATLAGYPVSTTHALVGGLVGAAGAVHWKPMLSIVVAPLLLTPIVAGAVSALLPKRGSRSLHVLSGATVCFARALNDAPKIAGLCLLVPSTSGMKLVMVAVVMAAAGLVQGRGVAERMAKRITPLDAGRGAAANFTASAIVMAASILGLPASTTHVTCGALFGLGTSRRALGSIAASWMLTLPVSAALAWTMMP